MSTEIPMEIELGIDARSKSSKKLETSGIGFTSDEQSRIETK